MAASKSVHEVTVCDFATFSQHLVSSPRWLAWADDYIDGPDEAGPCLLVLNVQGFQ
jgi:hypothetical protein